MKNILILSDCNSVHTIKWVNGLLDRGFSIILFSLRALNHNNFRDNLILYDNNLKPSFVNKLKYISTINKINSIIKKHKIDILHSHYASSYGLLGALSGFKPFFISVWGSDVFDFPNKSFLHKLLIKYNLSLANIICSTSHIMKEETLKYTNKDIEVVPFGIDVSKFKKLVKDKELLKKYNIPKKNFIFGTIKTLELKYGIDYLIDAYNILIKEDNNIYKNSSFLIVGGGSLEKHLKEKVRAYGILEKVVFTGYIDPSKIHIFHNLLDLGVYGSIYNSESFGVSVLETNACEKGVIVSDIAGFKEVVKNGFNGIHTKAKDLKAIKEAMKKLYYDKNLRVSMGENGRKLVLNKYNFANNLESMISIYINYK